MESRKIYVSGGSTHVISLPKKWVTRNSLKAGDSLLVTEQGSSLVFGTSVVEKESRAKELRISQVPSAEALGRIIISFYLAGYDTIKIRMDKKDHIAYRESARRIISYLIGAEIVEDTDNAIVIEVMLDYKRMNTKWILQKMFFINESMLLDFGNAIKNADTALAKDVMVREKEVDRLYFLVVRQLNGAAEHHDLVEKLGIKNQKDCLGYRVVVKALERIADHIENAAKSYIELSEAKKEAHLEHIVELSGIVAGVFGKSMQALFSRNYEAAEAVFLEFKKAEKAMLGASKDIETGNVQSAILRKAILDSLGRVAGYSEDIAEIAINMSAEAS